MNRREKFLRSGRDLDLYYYAISCALSALVGHTKQFGRGWYHYADGELIVAAEVAL